MNVAAWVAAIPLSAAMSGLALSLVDRERPPCDVQEEALMSAFAKAVQAHFRLECSL